MVTVEKWARFSRVANISSCLRTWTIYQSLPTTLGCDLNTMDDLVTTTLFSGHNHISTRFAISLRSRKMLIQHPIIPTRCSISLTKRIFSCPILSGTLSGLGVLDSKIVQQLKDCLESAKQLHKKAEEDPKCAKTALGAQLIATATHGIGHLERLPMSRRQQKFIFCQLQRCIMELLALIRYISVLQPLMNSPDVDANHVKKPCDAVGAFFVNPNDAHLFWKAGIPVACMPGFSSWCLSYRSYSGYHQRP